MKTISVHDAKTNLSKYIAAAKRGEKIAIGAYGKYEVSLVVEPELIPQTEAKAKKPYRQLGTLKGKIWVAPDAFSKELDDQIADAMINNKSLP
ncbi:MAG TPA: hypothetical protein VH234_04730 [Candidatus Saccharimonadales bacterium]|jgi:antitoxin (DNA-binding transcriptional repressor) of toxin-antitoxin stability system|nr:hypothetical protein [Candidatus Saccharimonadales bacterium]